MKNLNWRNLTIIFGMFLVLLLIIINPATGQEPSGDSKVYLPILLKGGKTSPPPPPDAGDNLKGYDPLTEQEQAQMITTALNRGSGVSPQANEEILLVERHQESKEVYKNGTWTRRSDVYIYNYQTDTLVQVIVNNETGAVEEEITIQGVQLPLTANEVDRAAQIVWSDDSTRQQLQTQYATITGQTLQSLDQLNVKAFVFHAESMPTDLNASSQQCGVHRCAQLLVYTGDEIAFEMTPIVDLSSGIVAQVLDF